MHERTFFANETDAAPRCWSVASSIRHASGSTHDFRAVRRHGWQVVKPFFAALAVVSVLFVSISLDVSAMGDRFEQLRGSRVAVEDLDPSWVEVYGIVVNGRVTWSDDADGDELSFAQEADAFTDPFSADTDNDGVSDADELTAGQDPRGSGLLDTDTDGMPDIWERMNGLDEHVASADADTDADGLSDKLEYAHATDPRLADTDGDHFSDLQEILNGYDPTVPGDAKPEVTVLIPGIDVAAPMIWSQSDDDQAMLQDLERGVIHYAGTAAPGAEGNTIIAGHSSNYAWAKGDYNSIFRELGKLADGDRAMLRVRQGNGKSFDYVYRVTERRVVRADNPWIFEEPEERSALTLSTCWPVGTTLSRLVIRAELSEVVSSAI